MRNSTKLIRLLVVPSLLSLAAGAVLADAEADEKRYEEQRALAESQAAEPDVLAYRQQIDSDLEANVSRTFLECTRRSLYSRRAVPDLVLTVGEDGTVSEVTPRFQTQMSVCYANSLARVTLPAPPTSPLRIALASPASSPATP